MVNISYSCDLGTIMTRQIIDIGTVGNDGTGDSIRDSFRKVNDNFKELYGSLGLGEKLQFTSLEDTPNEYGGNANSFLAVNAAEDSLIFKSIVAGIGIQIDDTTNPNETRIFSTFASVSGDTSPSLGGDLSASFGGNQFRINNLPAYDKNLSPPGGPISRNEAVSKGYADSKISLAGVNAVDPETGVIDNSFGVMSGPLILSRNPEADDDLLYDGLIAATKSYVDNSSFGSSVNLYVSQSGSDLQGSITPELKGRALAYAYRTIEAALKRAEEIILQSRKEIGPYKKTLTYNNGANFATLEKIESAPNSGTGFDGDALMSVSASTISVRGVNYNVGDIVTVTGGTFIEPARFQVLTTTATPGGISTFRVVSTGQYSVLPGNIVDGERIVTTTATTSTGGSTFGNGAQFSVSFSVSSVVIINGGENYSLVSVRAVPAPGDSGSGAFGRADIVGGEIVGISITDGGSGFLLIPTIVVNLPRFLIKTEGNRTDFTGIYITDTADAIRSRDIREGLYLRGETSGALAQILGHTAEIDSDGNEIFDVDIIYGTFQDKEIFGSGELISYGDVSITTHITVLVESGIYEENYPLRVPQNVTIFGDDFRRVIVRPKPGLSSSPWAGIYFRRDRVIDGMDIADQEFGYHYLQDSSQPIYPVHLINNKGDYRSAAELIKVNRSFLAQQVVNWIDAQIPLENSPFTAGFVYDKVDYTNDLLLLISSIAFDLEYGDANRTISDALKIKDKITSDLSERLASIERLNTLCQLVVQNIRVTELYNVVVPQVIDGAFVAESGTVGNELAISNILRENPAAIITTTPHGLTDGTEIVISQLDGFGDELNGNNFFIKVINATTFNISELEDLSILVNGTSFPPYAGSGKVTVVGGVIQRLTTAAIRVLEESDSVNYPKDNDLLDVFLANDAVRWQGISGQGHGGFMMVLDPFGQILAKSPYPQECSSFSGSTGRQRFAGGMFVDGFTGNIRFRILGKLEILASQMVLDRSYTIKTVGTTDFTTLGALSNTVGLTFIYNGVDATGSGTVLDNSYLLVSGLSREPQLPASFIVSDTVYRINYIRDYNYQVSPTSNTAVSTASFILDETTPWPFPIVEYDEDICYRDVGLIIEGLGFDIALETNFHQRRGAISYRQANSVKVVNEQLDITIRAIEYAHDLATEVTEVYAEVPSQIAQSKASYTNIVRNGQTFAPNLSLKNPPAVDVNLANAKNLLLTNEEYIIDEVLAWVDAQIAGTISPFAGSFTYNKGRWYNYFTYLIEALAYDILYGGNSATRYEALRFYNGVGDLVQWQLETGAEQEVGAAISQLSVVAQAVIFNSDPIPTYSGETRISGTPASATEQALINSLLTSVKAVVENGVGSLPVETLPDLTAYDYSIFFKAARVALLDEKTNIQDETIVWVEDNINVYEVLMPGNRSMVCNDFTQINDMGYGIVVTNGALTEAVSMFTYYCYISYYSIKGGQIRSVAGSSAHGVYALVAEGADPLEIPTPVTAYYDFSQGATIFADGGQYTNAVGGFTIFINNYTYVPLENSEIEVDYGFELFNYRVSNVSTEALPEGIARLTIQDDTDEGWLVTFPNGVPVTIRQNAQTVLTGDVVLVQTRPSTGLILAESEDVYRILAFREYDDPVGGRTCSISIDNPATVTRINHELLPNYQIEFLTPVSVFEGSISGTTLTVSSIGSGTIVAGMDLNYTGRVAPMTIVNQLTGSAGGVGTYTVSSAVVVAPIAMTATGSLPAGINPKGTPGVQTEYFIISDGFTPDSFNISLAKNGSPVATTAAGIGIPEYVLFGLARTDLRENYNYIEYNLWPTQPFVSGTTFTVTISTGTNAVFTTSSPHGYNANDAIRFVSSGNLPQPLSQQAQYFVGTVVSPTEFTVHTAIGETEDVDTFGIQSGTHTVGRVVGNPGDSEVAVEGVNDQERVLGSKFVFLGQEYLVTGYDDPSITDEQYGLLRFSPPLQNSANQYNGLPTWKGAVPKGAPGTLTIRIALTRVTSHDLLDIGTGSYADTNYPNEIFGAPRNPPNPETETEERSVGRVFYVTTDQFGNFSVGPYFRVDQGTGAVTFSASIALSNLDGLGFKRGVTISEFSTDGGMSDNDSDAVPVESAIRTYIGRRLGITHEGSDYEGSTDLLIPADGGFMSLQGQLPMRSNMNLGLNKIINLKDCELPQDAVNLRSLTFNNFQDITVSNVASADIITFTGVSNQAQNSTVVGDISFSIDSTANTVDAQINPDTIIDSDVNSAAAIAQSKLAMNAATLRADATGILQADLGLASFNNLQFTATNGWIELQTASSSTTGVTLNKIQYLGDKKVIGNASGLTAAASAVDFSTVINQGLGIKKSQYSSTGFLRRSNSISFESDGNYDVIDMSAQADPDFLVVRDSNGDFSGNVITATQYKIDNKTLADTSSSGVSGSVILYTFDTFASIFLGDGAAVDQVNTYRNGSHVFEDRSNNPGSVSCGTISAANITGTGSPTVMTGTFTLASGSTLQATYADLAEYYEADRHYDVGTVLVFGGDKEVTVTSTQGDHRIAGVVSENAAFIMNERCPGEKTLLALQGRVPCRVVGKINKGDLMICSSINGVAVSAGGDAKAGTIIGKALENYNSDHIGMIEIAVGRS